MTIMAKAVTAVNDKIVVNTLLRNLEVIDDSIHQPVDPDFDPDHNEDEEIAVLDNGICCRASQL